MGEGEKYLGASQPKKHFRSRFDLAQEASRYHLSGFRGGLNPEADLPTFGFSAFLKLICLNDRPQRTEVRRRVAGAGDGGYDYHASLKRLSTDVIERQLDIETVLAKAHNIKKEPERRSAIQGLSNLNNWLPPRPYVSLKFDDFIYTSPGKHFNVRFTSDLGLIVRSRETAIHIWNTISPTLSDNLVRMAMALISSKLTDKDNAPQDLGVLDLRNQNLILLSEATLAPNSGLPLAERLDRIFQSVKSELENRDGPTDRPSISPP